MSELNRTFLIEGLPEPLTRASSHLQIYDNYIPDTRFRTRSIRDPYSNSWSYLLQQQPQRNEAGVVRHVSAEMHLTKFECDLFEPRYGGEIRKNRYFHEFDLHMFTFDVYLGRLWGLNMVSVAFETAEDMNSFDPPPFAVIEVTLDPFFDGRNLITKTFDDIQSELARIGAELPASGEIMDE